MHANRLMPNVYRKKLLAFTISELHLLGRTSGSVRENLLPPLRPSHSLCFSGSQ